MSEQHKSFLIYHNWRSLVDCMDDESAGKLIKGLFVFSCDGEIVDFGETPLAGIYQMMVNVLSENHERYLKRCEKNRENGKLGGRPSQKSGRFSEKANESERFSEKANKTQTNPNGEEWTGNDWNGEDWKRQEMAKISEEEQQAFQKELHEKLLASKARIDQHISTLDT